METIPLYRVELNLDYKASFVEVTFGNSYEPVSSVLAVASGDDDD